MDLLGKTLIWAAVVGTILSLILYLRGERWTVQARWSFRAVTLALTAALVLLLTLILNHRFEFIYVRNYSSTDLPLYYLIATLWGGQEGTLLLWIFLVGVLGLIFTRMAGRFERFSMATVNLFVLCVLLILLKRSPFAATPTGPTEGAGLNPLLQDFWMTIHPPVMFIGFALSVFPFAIAVAGWLRGEFKQWISIGWVWLLATWCTLGTALVMGGYWAYKVLGWGGYWAWDPVENSSLIPWLFATGGIHALVMLKKKNALARSAFLFSILPFISILFGSFLTRSGVLADFSVHSFLDLGINSYLLASLGLFTLIGFGVLFWRMNRVKATVAYSSMTTVDFCISMGVLSLLIAGALVLIGMSTPLWSRLGGPPSNVTLRYYFLATTPVALILLLGLSVFPFMRWIKPSRPWIAPQAAIPFTASMVVGIFAILAGVHEPLYIVLLTLGTFATVSNGWLVVDRFRKNKTLAGAYVAHVGLAMLVVGAAVSTAYETKEQVALPLGQPVEKMGWVLTYEGKDPQHPKGQTPYHVLAARPGSDVAYRCSPQQYMLPYDKGMMRKPAVKKFWNKDLYISPLDEVGGGPQGKTAILERGRTQTLGGFDVTFLGFDMPGHDEGSVNRVGCPIEIVGDMMVDTLSPGLENTPQGLRDLPVTFADGRYTLTVTRIEASTGRIELRLADRDDPTAAAPVFWIELAEKPLINLFWLGTTLMVLGGILALRKRELQRQQLADDSGAKEKPASDDLTRAPAQTAPVAIGTDHQA